MTPTTVKLSNESESNNSKVKNYKREEMADQIDIEFVDPGEEKQEEDDCSSRYRESVIRDAVNYSRMRHKKKFNKR